MYILISVDWDTKSEELRWMMDKMGISYIEIPSLPRLAHDYTLFPILKKDDQVYTQVSKATVFLYASNLFSCPWRAYAYPEAIDLQEYFDETLFKASKGIFYEIILSDTKLFRKCIINSGHYDSDRIICDGFWPIIYVYFRFKTFTFDKNLALKSVNGAFEKAEKLLSKSLYLCGPQLSAADISFVSHAMGILWPTADDMWAENCTIELPCIREIPIEWREMIQKFRKTKAGSWAMKCIQSMIHM